MASTEFKLDAQRILNHNQPKIINVIKFDELLADCSEQYKNCLNQKYSLLSVMSRDYINLGQLEKQTQELQNDRKLLYQNIITIFQINCLSIPLQVLCEGYEECLTIERTFTQLYQQQRKNGSGLKNHIYFYSDDSTAVYISMLNDIGKIVKVAKNFQDVVPMVENSFQAIGKNIGFIMPEQIAQNHDKILMNCLEKKQLSEEIREYPIILGKDQNGWSFPFHLKIQMCMIGYDELGACGWLKQIVDDNLYLMSSSSSENLQIYLLDYSFYDLIFSQCMSQSDSKKVKLGNIIPLLKQIVNKGIVGKYYEMLVIQPQRFSDVQVDRDKFDENLIRNLMNMNLFQIKLAFFPINNPHCEFVQYQVVSLKPLIEVKQRKEAIRNFQIQMLDIADLDLFDGDIDAGLKLFNLNSESNLAQSDIIFKSNLNKGNSQLNGLNYDKMEEYTGKQESSDQIKERGFHLDLNQVEISTQITRKKSIRLGEDSPMKKQFFDNYVKQIKQNMTQTKIMFSDLNTRSQITKLNSEKSIQSINTILQKPLIENEILLLPAISDTHRSVNIMSQDTQPYFSPLSTNRKGQVFSESAKLILNKVESNILSNPIIENSVEDDLIPSRFQYSQRKLRVSLSDKVNQFNGEATFTKIINQSENQLSEDKKSITQEQKNKDFLDDKDGSTQSSLISKSSAKQQYKFKQNIYQINKIRNYLV